MALDDDDSLASSIAAAMAYSHQAVWSHLPGRVETYDAATQRATITPLVKDLQPERLLPVLPNVPVLSMRGGGLAITLPCPPGSTGMLLVMTLAIDQWMATGVARAPTDARRNSLTSCVFLPGLSADGDALSSVDQDHIVLAREGSTPQFVALANKVDAFISALDTMFRTGWVVAPNDGGGALKAAFATAFGTPPLTVASADVKVT